MSRIGKVPVPVPSGVQISIGAGTVSAKGPKGTLAVETLGHVDVKLEEGKVHVRRYDDSRRSKAFHGLYQRLITNIVNGVATGFKKELEIQGIGYKAALQGKDTIVLNVGLSHQVEFKVPAGVLVQVPKPTTILLESADKQLLGQTAANLRGVRPPEPYGGKGIRYAGERVVLKEGKKSTK
ncbi:MAG: 50S ribosomal protein L6 [Candidatus Sumerlaeia bacterium]|nr:50S ribosomal protein L6 [Candidatus Sumerlaeia bacterium]